jgi:hypothetical protein
MTRRATLLGTVLLSAIIALSSAGASAGTFSTPARLPGSYGEWRFAVNNRGEAVGVLVSGDHAVVAQLTRSGHIERSWPLALPGRVAKAVLASIALGEHGSVAVGVLYSDGQRRDEPEYPHEDPGCCDHIAIATWHLGKPPPAAQAVSPELNASTENVRQPWPAPIMVVGRSTVTALWIRGGDDPNVDAEDRLEEAFGRVGRPLHTARLLKVPGTVRWLDLHLAADDTPVASWIDDEDMIRTVSGRPSGALRSPRRFQRIPGYGRDTGSASGVGFSHDEQGHTMFAYLSGSPERTQRLMTITSTDGGPFMHSRAIASIPAHSGTPSLYAGGDGSLLAIWTHTREADLTEHFEARRGSVLGSFARPLQLGEIPFSLSEFDQAGFLDSHGRAVIIQGRRSTHHPNHYELVALTAQPDRPFERPRPIAPALLDCPIDGETPQYEEPPYLEPIATSSNGRAVLLATCGEGSGQRASQYLIRYTPSASTLTSR